LIRHNVACDVNLNVVGCASRCIQQQAMSGMESVKRPADQTALEAEPFTHGLWSVGWPLSSSPHFGKKRPSTKLCPDT
jgi:hypothetical protein